MDQSSSHDNDSLSSKTRLAGMSRQDSPAYAAFSVVGVAFCWVIEFMFVKQLIGGQPYGLLSLLLFNSAAALCFFLVSYQKEHLSSKKARLVMQIISGAAVALFISASLYAHFAAVDVSGFVCLCSAFVGFAVGWLMLNWVASVDTTLREKAPRFVAFAALVGAGISLVISLLQQIPEFYAFLVVILIAYLGLFFAERHVPAHATQVAALELPVPLSKSVDYMMALYSLCLSCCFAYSLMRTAAFDTTLAASLVALSLAVASIPALLLWQRWPKYLTFGNLHRAMLPITVFLLFSIVLFDPAFVLVSATLALAAHWGLTINSTSWFVAFARRYGYEPIHYYANARRLPSLGATLGFLIAGVTLAATEGLKLPFNLEFSKILVVSPENTLLIVICILTILLLIINSLLPFNRGTPMDGRILIDIETSDRDPEIVTVKDDNASVVRPKRFVQHANDLASKYGLSTREQEVMHLLIRGYSADTIADFLSVSRNTVRTHRANIYQKFNVHSQQELMRLLPIPVVPTQEDKYHHS